MENYEIITKIGKGNFGSIYKIRRKSDNKIFCWKEMDYGHMTQKEKQSIVNEVNILREFRHPNIVKYYDRIIDKKNTKIYIIMEYCENGDINQLIKKYKKNKEYIPEEKIWKILIQLLLALNECHNHKEGKILHRDIKPSNVFLDKDNNIKLGDFGLSRMLSNESIFAYSHVGTPYYMSPEQIDEINYDDKSDIWSFGCFLYECTTLNHPFEARNQIELAMKIKNGKVNNINNSFYSKELINIIMGMLNVNLKQRPNCEMIINCPSVFIRIREMKLMEHYLSVKKFEEGLKNKERDFLKRESLFLDKEKKFEEKEIKLKEFEEELNKRKKDLDELENNLKKKEEEVLNKEKEVLEKINKLNEMEKNKKNNELDNQNSQMEKKEINVNDFNNQFELYNNIDYRKTSPTLISNNLEYNDFTNSNNGMSIAQNSYNYFINQNMNKNNYFNESNDNFNFSNNNNVNEMSVNNNQNLYQQQIRYEKIPQVNNTNNYFLESNNNINNYLYDYNNMSTNTFIIENAPISNNYNETSNKHNQFMDSSNSIENYNYEKQNNNINEYLKSTNGTSINSISNIKKIEKKNPVDKNNNIKNIIKNSVSITHKTK